MGKNFVRKLEASDLNSTKVDQKWYVPPHPVTQWPIQKNLKSWGVSAKLHQNTKAWHSLNDKIIAGSGLKQSLIAFVFQFPQNSIAKTTDVEAMFRQVKVSDLECNKVQFLKKDNLLKPVKVFKYTRHVFGVRNFPIRVICGPADWMRQ